VDQEDQGDHNPAWWTRTGFYILLMCRAKGGSNGPSCRAGGVKEACSD